MILFYIFFFIYFFLFDTMTYTGKKSIIPNPNYYEFWPS